MTSPSIDSSRLGFSLEQIISSRRSVRRFRHDPVDRALLLQLIEAARWAPSPHGRQPWRFVVIESQTTKDHLAEAMGVEWQQQLALDGEDQQRVAERLRISKLRIQSAPAIILPCLYMAEMDAYPDPTRQQAEQIMAIQSLGCAIQNMLLQAYALGLDTGWMCAPLFCPDVVRSALDLDASLTPHALIPVGYAAADPNRRPHKPVEELTLWR
jgi:F420 biosynthesis protein FbiB-like protein